MVARGVLTTKITVGSKILRTAFFVVDDASYYNLLLGREWIHRNECILFTLHRKIVQWVDDKVEEIAAGVRLQLADVSIELINHVGWVDEDPDQISLVRMTEEGVQVKLLGDASHLAVGDEPP